ncbi:MAG: hypothetical protein IJM15_05200, partial [Erysipelotrichaceae bacterium]|nr:hypothetical protein [Erysipelotrichaceae bacterium]
DLFGKLRSELEKKFDTTASILQGSAGDMGNRQYRQGNDYAEVERETRNLIDQICWRLDWKDIDMDGYSINKHTYIASYHHSAEEYAAKIADFEERLKDEKDFDMIKLLQSGIGGFKRNQVLPTGDYVRDMPYSIINMNDLQIVAIPGEYGSYLALRVLAASKARYCMVLGYTNGRALGYMIEKEAFDQFSQEANVTVWPAGICDLFTEDVIKNL